MMRRQIRKIRLVYYNELNSTSKHPQEHSLLVRSETEEPVNRYHLIQNRMKKGAKEADLPCQTTPTLLLMPHPDIYSSIQVAPGKKKRRGKWIKHPGTDHQISNLISKSSPKRQKRKSK